jgi:hypothetical protein
MPVTTPTVPAMAVDVQAAAEHVQNAVDLLLKNQQFVPDEADEAYLLEMAHTLSLQGGVLRSLSLDVQRRVRLKQARRERAAARDAARRTA